MFLDRKDAHDRIRKLGAQFGFEIDPDAQVGSLSVGWQQRVEILKALYRDAKILVLDEPTAVLTPAGDPRDLRGPPPARPGSWGRRSSSSATSCYEVLEIADRITVIRRGKVVGSPRPGGDGRGRPRRADGRPRGPAHGRPRREPPGRHRRSRSPGCTSTNDRGREVVHDVELRGAWPGRSSASPAWPATARTSWSRRSSGCGRVAAGTVTLDGRNVTGASPRRMHQLGVGFVPADRHRYGIVLSFPLTDNLVPQRLLPRRRTRAAWSATTRRSGRNAERLDRRVRRADAIGDRDRGDALGRQPAEGGRRRVSSTASCGCSCSTSRRVASTSAASSSSIARRSRSATPASPSLLVSAELDEVLELSDRIGVMYRGRIVTVLDARTHESRGGRPADGHRRARGSAAAGGGRLVSDRPVTPERCVPSTRRRRRCPTSHEGGRRSAG